MNFDEIIDTLFDGSKEQMQSLTCPECGKSIFYEIANDNSSMRVQCVGCGSRVNLGKLSEIPNCLALFGNRHTF